MKEKTIDDMVESARDVFYMGMKTYMEESPIPEDGEYMGITITQPHEGEWIAEFPTGQFIKYFGHLEDDNLYFHKW